MREIKFRVWDKYLGEMIHPNNVRVYSGPVLFELDDGKEWVEPADYERFELMQYSGLDDKNGKEIYEGDIINLQKTSEWDHFDANYSIGFTHGVFSVEIDHDSENEYILYYLWDYNQACEIVGNIYQNPELL